MESIHRVGKNNLYNRNFNYDNKTYTPARTTTPGCEKTEYFGFSQLIPRYNKLLQLKLHGVALINSKYIKLVQVTLF